MYLKEPSPYLHSIRPIRQLQIISPALVHFDANVTLQPHVPELQEIGRSRPTTTSRTAKSSISS
ncbi:hypothetical protein EDB95_0034 [Dinghuibacter silviterrae]|uniref:Uncharacterized protein n=1 Tax=Dinghuibacter silviterrae TaxID=1539049 RepID=A0A4R8DMW6_9BACT|nr:hypothetical protein EDB95_0034 [Dinghuibacter silviterrae]